MPNKFIPPQTDSVARSAATPLDGEVFYDTDEKKLYYGDGTTVGGLVIGSGGHTIEEEGTPLTQRAKLNFVGDSITVTDDAGNDRTIVTVNVPSGGRELLTANRTYYVRTDGSDSNNGLTDTAGGAFLTIQKAINTLLSIDGGGKAGIIQIGDGTYTLTSTLYLNGFVGFTSITIQGNSTTPSNVLITTSTINNSNTTANTGLFVVNGTNTCTVLVKDLKVSTTATTGFSYLIRSLNGGYLQVSNIDFGACTSGATTAHLALSAGIIEVTGNYSITGGAFYHVLDSRDGVFVCQSRTLTLTGTPNFSVFLLCVGSQAYVNGNTYTGSATGQRYLIEKLSYCQVSGAGTSYFPGSVAGTTDGTTGGYYV